MATSASSPPLLSALLDLINSATHTLQAELAAAHLPEPWLDAPALHPWDETTPSHKYWDARRTLLSALGMMTAVVQNPREKVLVQGMGYHHPAALNFTVRARIPDILAEPDVDELVGLPVTEIARRAGTHPAKTTAVLRFLCIHHVFSETAPGVFANNKLSQTLKAADPTSGAPVFWGEISFRAATALSLTMRAPDTASSLEVNDAPFVHAFSRGFDDVEIVDGDAPEDVTDTTARTAFAFLASPRHATYRASFASGMRALELMHGPEGLRDFAWARWDVPGAVFVDVGASTGHLARTLLPGLQHASFECQDRPEVAEHGEAWFAENDPHALATRRVVFRGNDFLTGQPVRGASLYILQNILHDWPEAEGLVILKHIAAAMAPASRLLVIEVVVRPAVVQTSAQTEGISGRPPSDVNCCGGNVKKENAVGAGVDVAGLVNVENGVGADKERATGTNLVVDASVDADAEALDAQERAPWPLLANYGIVNAYAHHQGVEMINLFNALDRTLGEYAAMFAKAGLALVQVHPLRKAVGVMEVRRVSSGEGN